MKEVADEMGVGDTFVPTPVGVFFGPDGKKTPGKTVRDPYFGGAGPDRTGCIECGSCMTGCRYGAKNTLVKNYLGLAESAGAQVHPMTTVTGFEQRPDGRLGGPHRAHRPLAAQEDAHVHRHAMWCWPRAPGALRSCCSRCATGASCPSSPTSSAC